MNFEEQGILAGLKKHGHITRALQAAGIAQMPTSQTMGFAAGGVIDEQTHPELAGSVTASTSIQPSTSAVLAPKQSGTAASLPNFGDNSSAGLNARLQFMQNQNAGGQIGDASKPLDSNPAISPTESLPLNAGAPRETTWQEDTDARQARINDMASSLKTMEANGRANSLMGSSSSITPAQPAPQLGILKGRGQQINKAAGYANGGKIKGPGTPTSDSIPARVRETGEPIKVSTGERIVSHAQEGILQGIAQNMGFKNLDQLLEAKTGKPVGPTIKGGIAAAADGLSPETDPDTDGRRQYSASGEHGVSQNVGIAAKPKTIDIGGIPHLDLPDQKYPGPLSMAASAAAGTIGHVATAPFGNRAEERLAANRAELNNETAEPQAKIKPTLATSAGITGGVQTVANRGVSDLAGRQGAYMVENNLRSLEDKGYGILRQVGANGGRTFTNVGTESITDPTKKVADNSYNGVADNESMAKANAIRQSIIDRQPMGGVGILNDPTEAANAETTARWRQDALLKEAKYGNRAAGDAIQANAQLGVEGLRSATNQRGQDVGAGITARGQDMNLGIESRRQAIDAPLKQAQTQGIVAQNESDAMIANIKKKAMAGDAQAMASYQALTGKKSAASDRFITVQGGEEIGPDGMTKIKKPSGVFDAQTQRFVPMDGAKQGSFSKADVDAALKSGADKAKVAERIKSLGGNPTDYGL